MSEIYKFQKDGNHYDFSFENSGIFLNIFCYDGNFCYDDYSIYLNIVDNQINWDATSYQIPLDIQKYIIKIYKLLIFQ